MSTLYEEMKRLSPQFFDVDRRRHKPIEEKIVFTCKNCIVRDRRAPEHCDRCSSNPDAERLKKAGLL